MDKSCFRAIWMATGISAGLACALFASAGVEGAEEESHLQDYNVVWDSQSADSSQSMPCGGHDIGLNVWVEKGDILFYMQRSGSLAEQNEYLKLGRMRLRLDPNPFADPNAQFRQELKLREGYVEIRAESEQADAAPAALVRIWVETARPIIRVDVESAQPVDVLAAYENWRLEDEMIPNNDRRHSFFSLNLYPGDVSLRKDVVEHSADGVLFYHRNPGKDTLLEKLLRQQGLADYRDDISDDLRQRTFGALLCGDGFVADGVSTGRYQTSDFKAWNLRSEKAARRHHLRIVTHIAQTETIADWERGLRELAAESDDDREQAFRASRDWWEQFWDRSWILINPDSPDPAARAWRVGRNYNLFRYQLGCNAYGEYPSKFNGGSFTFDANLVGGSGRSFGPDWRRWGGGVFTAQNQRLLHWPMLKAGDLDAILPQFELYRKALPGATARVRANFDHDGAVYSEYIGVPGLALGCAYGWDSGARGRGTEIPFGDPRADGSRGYNDLVEQGVMANPSIAYHWESQLEHAYMILEYQRFSGADISKYMPFIENAVIFFDEHYRKRQQMRNGRELDEDGKLVIFPSTACETYRGARNPGDVIAGLQACLNGILALDDSLLSLRDKDYYRSFQEIVPDFSYSEVGSDKIILPAKSWLRRQNAEKPQFYPLFPFNRFNLLGADEGQMDIFRATWKHGDFRKDMVQSWHQDGIFLARMGMTRAAMDFNSRKLDDSPRRFPTFWGPGHDWVPDHNWGGSGMLGLQEMLLQTIGDEIRLFPAWPKDWDVDFKLHAPRQTTISGRLKDGKLIELKLSPESRRKDLVICEPR
jgi:hypothetical protein